MVDDSDASAPHADAPESASHAGSHAGESPASLLRSEELLQGRREILIAHCEEVYRLRLTRNGKLILTK